MSSTMIEQELIALKRRVELLEKTREGASRQTWREAFGAMKEDSLLHEAARLGQEWRAEENKRR